MDASGLTLTRAGFALGLTALAAPALASDASPRYGRVLERYYAAKQFDGIAMVAVGDRIVYRGAAGLADRERNRRHTTDETFRIASVTKQFASVLAMQEVRRGTLALDAPIGTYLPTLPEATHAITMRQLLKNISGLPNLDTIAGAYTRTDAALDDLPTYVASLPLTPLVRAPGTAFSYNNLDFLVVGALLQRVTGSSFAALLRERIVRPLGLSGTGVYGNAPIPDAHVKGYEDGGTALVPEKIGLLRNFGPSGAMYSTLADLFRWDRALLRNRLLEAAATREMFTGDTRFGFVGLGSWVYDMRIPGVPEKAHLIERQGNIGGIQIVNVLSPQDDIAIVAMANTDYANLFTLYAQKGLPYELASLAIQAARGART